MKIYKDKINISTYIPQFQPPEMTLVVYIYTRLKDIIC